MPRNQNSTYTEWQESALPDPFFSLSQWPEVAEMAAADAGTVLLATARVDAENTRSYLFRNPREVLTAYALEDIPQVFQRIEEVRAAGSYLAGYLSYECGHHFEPRTLGGATRQAGHGLPLMWFGVYDAPYIYEHPIDAQHGVQAGVQPTAPLGAARQGAVPLAEPEMRVTVSRKSFCAAVARIKRYIEAGDTYQVNLSMPVEFGPCSDPAALFAALLQSQPVSYGALLNLGDAQLLSLSPELFFRVRNGGITVRPMKGTAQRGLDCEEDAAQASWLSNDEKNRSENVMIVDLLRNDLGRICTMGSVAVSDLFAVERYPTLLQMTSTVSGQLRTGVQLYEIFRSLFPCGSIVGAPKVRTMQIIRELEQRERGVYTGAIGFIGPARDNSPGDAVFNVAIRTIAFDRERGVMGVGAGIVYDSDPAGEYDECVLKAQFLRRQPPAFELIETILWRDDYFLLDLHLDRLLSSARYFDFACDRERVLQALSAAAAELEANRRHRVRLLLSRAGGIAIRSEPLSLSRQQLRILISKERTYSKDVFLRHKTTHRPLYDRLSAQAKAEGFDDALVLNEREEVTEGAIHNLVACIDGVWHTPPLSSGVLPGVYRRRWLATHPEAVERPFTVEQLFSAGRIMVCNSLRGMREVMEMRVEGTGSEWRRAESASCRTAGMRTPRS